MVLIESALLSSFFSALGDKIVKKLDEVKEQTKPKDIQIVHVKEDPDSYSVTVIDDVTTDIQKWTNKDKPQLQFDNELKKTSIVREISIIPDTNFKTLGKILVTIDDVPVFISKSFTAFEKISETVVTINKTIKQDSKVKFFLISSDGSVVGITAQVTFGEL